jgi:site-specific DNA recombinase
MEGKSQSVAFYARVSSEQQAQAGTIASQVAALEQRIAEDAGQLREELRFIDDGYSGSTLLRPALERLRDVAAAGGLDRLYVHSPDRLARRYAYQVLLVEELQRYGVQIVFLNHPLGDSAEASLLLQMQGMIAEYERAKIMERSRRGKRHAARRGSVSAMTNAPFGYHYVPKHAGGGEAQYQVVLEEACVVREMFQWVAHEGCSLAEVTHRLNRRQIAPRRQARGWSRSTVANMLKNPTYKGSAVFGHTRLGPRRPRLRASRNCPEQPRRGRGIYRTSPADQERIPVPAIVSEELFAEVQTRLEENRRRHRGQPRAERYLLQGLTVCQSCGYAYCGGSAPKYYRCTGTDRYRFEGEAVCSNRLVRSELLDAVVWEDVCSLLSDPRRVKAEYERRLQQPTASSPEDGEQLDRRLSRLKQGIARLIDAYEDGLLEKSEFEPRIRQAKDRLQRLAEKAQHHAVEQSQQAELRLVLGHLNAFRERLQQGLSDVDWSTRRKIIRSLIKRVEITPDDIRVIYRIAPASPFDSAPASGPVQDCSMHIDANRDIARRS